MWLIVVVNFQLEALVVDVLDERGVPVHNRGVLVVDTLVEYGCTSRRWRWMSWWRGYEYWWLIEGIIQFIIETVAGLIVL